VALTGLQQLRSDVAVPLVVANAGDWEGLARLEHLTEIEVGGIDDGCWWG
jgi:hypothetical protein